MINVRKLQINNGELLKQLLAKNNKVRVIESSIIKCDDGNDMLLETVVVNETLQLIIVSDAGESVVIT